MILAAVIALMSAESSLPTLTLEQWEGCAKSTVSTCGLPNGTDEWKSCLEAADLMSEDWDMCEFVSFPDCFQDSQSDDIQTSPRLCAAQLAVAARSVALTWTSEVSALGAKAEAAQMRYYWDYAEEFANTDTSADPVEASGMRVGVMVSGLKAVAFFRNASRIKSPLR